MRHFCTHILRFDLSLAVTQLILPNLLLLVSRHRIIGLRSVSLLGKFGITKHHYRLFRHRWPSSGLLSGPYPELFDYLRHRHATHLVQSQCFSIPLPETVLIKSILRHLAYVRNMWRLGVSNEMAWCTS
jgi:hypothetical protein